GLLTFGISSLSSFGRINLSGSPAVLSGALGANLSNGFLPAVSNAFPVLSYGSKTGSLNVLNNPAQGFQWQVPYGSINASLVATVSLLSGLASYYQFEGNGADTSGNSRDLTLV